jgi:hypothetical protein
VGITIVTCRATDSHGNTGSASFFVRVNAPKPLATVSARPLEPPAADGRGVVPRRTAPASRPTPASRGSLEERA